MVIGITGGVGSGKSTILKIMEQEYGARIILADDVARSLQAPGKSCYGPIVEEFGEEILDMSRPDHPIDRGKLSKIVFTDPSRLEDLNALVHPMVKAAIMQEISEIYNEDSEALILVEAALLIESGYLELLDELWVVYAEKEVRIARLEASRGYTREKCEAIMASQLTAEEYAEYADFIIDNSGDASETRRQIAGRLAEMGLPGAE